MAAYGLTIPPKWFRAQTPTQYTKIGFMQALYKALLTVGMVPIRSFNPPGVDLEGTTEPVVSGTARMDLIWWLDYPTADTFTIAGVAYRPVIGIACYVEYDYYATEWHIANAVVVQTGYRRADRLLKADLKTDSLLRGSITANYGFGASSNSCGDDLYGSVAGAMAGSYIQLARWKTFVASTDANRTALKTVSNLHVILGPSGLVIQVGAGTGKADSNNLMNMALVFAGTRIPGRARIPAQDANLPLINPILPLYLNQSYVNTNAGNEGSIVSSLTADGVSYSGNRPSARILGMQHDLKYTTGIVIAQIFNLENIERPLLPISRTVTLNSPRAASPSAAHIMNRMAYISWYKWDDASDFYGPVSAALRAQPSPAWEDVWSAEGLRLCDGTAPAGEVTDPNTNKTWFLALAPALATMMAYEITSCTKYTTPSWTAYAVFDDQSFDLSSAGFSSVFPYSTAWTAYSTTFTCDSGQNQMTVTCTSLTGYEQMVITGEPSDGSQYLLDVQLQNRGTSAAALDAANLVIYSSTNDGTTWIPIYVAQNAGNNTGGTFYNLASVTGIPVGLSADGKIYLRFATEYNSTVGTRTSRVANIHIKRAQ